MRKLSSLVLMVLICELAGCGGFSYWPFEKKKQETGEYKPADSVKYLCDGGNKFFVRSIDKGNAAWLILSDREVSLAKVGSGVEKKYSNGITTLQINGNEATLELAQGKSYAGCKLDLAPIDKK